MSDEMLLPRHGAKAPYNGIPVTLVEALQLFGLSGFALAQPVFDLLARYGEFSIAHRIAANDLAVFSIALLLLPALMGWLAVRIFAALSPRSGRCLHGFWIAILVALTALPLLNAAIGAAWSGPGASVLVAGIALGLGCVFVFAISRFAAVRAFAIVLAAAPPIFLAIFAASGIFAKLATTSVPDPFPRIESDTPIVLVVFDELPLTSLLNSAAEIDPELYPNFAELAGTATWFRNASTVDWQTSRAVPAILTGRYPDGGLPILADHPFNLFSWLAGSIDLNVVEAQTMLAPATDASEPPSELHLAGMLSDLCILYLHVIAPADLASRLPTVNQTWRDFGPRPEEGESVEEALHDLNQRSYPNRGPRFRRFVQSIAACPSGCLNFIHILLPHWGWVYTPSGRRYYPPSSPGMNMKEYRWGDEDWWTTQGYQQHLVQLAFVDTLLGELVERLKALQMFDRAGIIVTTDHGAVFRPDEEKRRPGRARHPEEILAIPLLAKAPFQDAGAIQERNVSIIDILPMIADWLGAKLPFPVDGCSPFDPGCEERPFKILYDEEGEAMQFPAQLDFPSQSLAFKLELFGSEPGMAGLYQIGPEKDLVGRGVEGIPIDEGAPAQISLLQRPFHLARRAPERFTLARISGWLEGEVPGSPTPPLAIVRNGEIIAVAPFFATRNNGVGFSTLIPELPAESLVSDFDFYLVLESGAGPRLRPARVTMTRIEPQFFARSADRIGSAHSRSSGQP